MSPRPRWTIRLRLTLLYGGLAVVEGGLMYKYARAGLAADEPDESSGPAGSGDETPLALVY